LVEPPPLRRGVQDDTLDAALPRPRQARAHELLGDAAPAPRRVGVDVEDDPFDVDDRAAARQTRQNAPELHAAATDDVVARAGEPPEVLAADGVAQIRGNGAPQCLDVGAGRQRAHVGEHGYAMPGDDLGVVAVREANADCIVRHRRTVLQHQVAPGAYSFSFSNIGIDLPSLRGRDGRADYGTTF